MAITTTSAYKAARGITTTTDDAVIGVIVTQINDQIETLAGRAFDQASYTDTLDGEGTPAVFLTHTPVSALTSVRIWYGNSYEEWTAATSPTVSALFRLNADTGELTWVEDSYTLWALDHQDWPYYDPTPRWPEGRQNIVAVYTGGYSTVPPALAMHAHELIDTQYRLYTSAGQTRKDLASETLGSYSYSTRSASDIWLDLEQVVRPYRRIVL